MTYNQKNTIVSSFFFGIATAENEILITNYIRKCAEVTLKTLTEYLMQAKKKLQLPLKVLSFEYSVKLQSCN